MDETNINEVALKELEAKEGVRVIKHSRYRDSVAYIFLQDFKDGKRTYGYVIPRENGASWVYAAVGNVFMKSEIEVVKMLHKEATKVFKLEAKEARENLEKELQAKKQK